MPSGYGVPPGSPTEQLLHLIGRHGQRPAHIHFMVSAAGHTKLTTQINIPGDPYLDDDFAFATRDHLVVNLEKIDDPTRGALDVDGPFTSIQFDFTLSPAR
jgi:catechol 1,2-dioxygenase